MDSSLSRLGERHNSSAAGHDQPPNQVLTMGVTAPSTEVSRLHKPGVAGSSPAAAIVSLCFDEPIGQYHSDREWWSKSQLWDLYDQGPEYFAARYLTGTLDYSSSPSMERGSRVHEWAENPEAWWDRVVEIPKDSLGKDGRWTKASDEFFASVKADKPDAIVISAQDIAEYKQQFQKLLDNATFRELTYETEHREFSVRWQDTITGQKLRCRPDAATETVLWDIKTTREKHPLKSFWKSAYQYGYAFQAILYMEGARAAGINTKQFVFMVTSTVAPFRCHAVVLPEQLLDQARRQVRAAVADLRNRRAMDDWQPEDGGQITTLFVPKWIIKEAGNGSGSRDCWSE